MHAVCMHVVNALHYALSAVTSIVKHVSILGLVFRRWHISFCLYFLRLSLTITSMAVSR